MFRVKRRTTEEEMSRFLCFPKSAWMTSQSAKRLSWTINDAEEFKKNCYYIGVRNPLVGGVSVKAAEPKAEAEEEEEAEEAEEEEEEEGEEDGEEEPEEWPESLRKAMENSRVRLEVNRFCSSVMMGLLRSHRVVGMTAEDLARVQ